MRGIGICKLGDEQEETRKGVVYASYRFASSALYIHIFTSGKSSRMQKKRDLRRFGEIAARIQAGASFP